ncbi:rhomboid family intramembrane serine protease [Capnocytophaga haemolytica]
MRKEAAIIGLLVGLCVLLFIGAKVAIHTGVVSEYQLNDWLCVPPTFEAFAERWWTLVSYGFYHLKWEHLLGNMLLLCLVGQAFTQLFSARELLRTYLCGLLFGGAAFLIVSNYATAFTGGSILLGASAAVMSLLVYIALRKPTYEVYLLRFRLRVVYLVLAIVLYDIFTLKADVGGKIAHFGGILGGAISVISGQWLVVSSQKQEVRSEKSEARSQKREVSSEQSDTSKLKAQSSKLLYERLLDKVAASGYMSLTDKEKKFLFEASRGEGDT